MPDQVLPVSNLTEVGVVKDAPPVSLPPNVFSDARNVRFRDGAVRKMEGEANIFPFIFNSGEPGPMNDPGTLRSYTAGDLSREIVYVAWWPNPHVAVRNSGYYLLIVQETVDNNLVHSAYIVSPQESVQDDIFEDNMDGTNTYRKGRWEAHTNARWQHTFFQGGFAIIINNGVDVPHYILDPQRNPQDIEGIPQFAELPGWDSYNINEILVDDIFNADVNSFAFDTGQRIPNLGNSGEDETPADEEFVVERVDINQDQTLEPVIFTQREGIETLPALVRDSRLFNSGPMEMTNVTRLRFPRESIPSHIRFESAPGADGMFTDADGDTQYLFDAMLGTDTLDIEAIRDSGGTGNEPELVDVVFSERTIPAMTDLSFSWRNYIVDSDANTYRVYLEENTNTHVIVFAQNQNTEDQDPQLGVANGDRVRVLRRSIEPVTVRAGVIRSFGDFLVAGNLREVNQDDPDSPPIRSLPGVVRTSDAAAPGAVPNNWNPFAAGVSTADEFVVTSDGIVQDMVELQSNLYIYSNNSISVMRLTGNPEVPLVVAPVTTSYGALTTGSVIEFDGQHIVVGSQDIYLFGGHPGNIQSLADGRVRRAFYDLLNPLHTNNLFILRYQQRDEIWICFPSTNSLTGEGDTAYVWNYRLNNWTIRDLYNVVSGDVGPIPGGGLPATDITISGDESGDYGVTRIGSIEVQSIAANQNMLIPGPQAGSPGRATITVLNTLAERNIAGAETFDIRVRRDFNSGPTWDGVNTVDAGDDPLSVDYDFGNGNITTVQFPRYTRIIQPFNADQTYFEGERVILNGRIYEVPAGRSFPQNMYFPDSQGPMYQESGRRNLAGQFGRFHFAADGTQMFFDTAGDSNNTPGMAPWIDHGPVADAARWSSPTEGFIIDLDDLTRAIRYQYMQHNVFDVIDATDAMGNVLTDQFIVRVNSNAPTHTSLAVTIDPPPGASPGNFNADINLAEDTRNAGAAANVTDANPILRFREGTLVYMPDATDPEMTWMEDPGREVLVVISGDFTTANNERRHDMATLIRDAINEPIGNNQRGLWSAGVSAGQPVVNMTTRANGPHYFEFSMVDNGVSNPGTPAVETSQFEIEQIDYGRLTTTADTAMGPVLRITLPTDRVEPMKVHSDLRLDVSGGNLEPHDVVEQIAQRVTDLQNVVDDDGNPDRMRSSRFNHTNLPNGYIQADANPYRLLAAQMYTVPSGQSPGLGDAERVINGEFMVEFINFGNTGLLGSRPDTDPPPTVTITPTDRNPYVVDLARPTRNFISSRNARDADPQRPDFLGNILTTGNDFEGAYGERATPTYLGLLIQNSTVRPEFENREFYVVQIGRTEFLGGDYNIADHTGTNGQTINAEDASEFIIQRMTVDTPRLSVLDRGEGRFIVQPANYDDLANFVVEARINDTPENANWIYYNSLGYRWEGMDPPEDGPTPDTFNMENPNRNVFRNLQSDPLLINVGNERDEMPFKAHSNAPERAGPNDTQVRAVTARRPSRLETFETAPSLMFEDDVNNLFDVDRPWPQNEINPNLEFPIFGQVRLARDLVGEDNRQVRLNKLVAADIGWTVPSFNIFGRQYREFSDNTEFREIIPINTADHPEPYVSYIERKQLGLTPEFDTENMASIALWADGSTPQYFRSPNTQFARLDVRALGTNNPGELMDLSPEQEASNSNVLVANHFDVSEDYKIDMRVHGRFINIRVTDAGTERDNSPVPEVDGKTFTNTAEWRISGMQMDVQKGGRR